MLYLINYAQRGPARFVSHLEVLRALERALRRAELPLKLSQGFNPRPYLSFALPLPVGMSGRSELAVVELSDPLAPGEIAARVAGELPEGLVLKQVRPWPKDANLPGLVDAAAYRVRPGWKPEPSFSEANAAAADLRSRPHLFVEVRGEKRDIRPGLLELRVRQGREAPYLLLFLSAGSRRYVRPEWVLSALSELGGWQEDRPARVERLGLFACRGRRPVPLGALAPTLSLRPRY
ncbi:MAG: TIGR03936 family radical SAM-associated protein [Clostridia bacterium]|jgi:radical SAM-linked protein|nr:TIGR03936 family radical SAM-associated protein [Clostridia bacterium]MDH7573584.1 TIGR03936 family radical SAM-associated protein [Clostridia bacterium]